MNLRDILTAGIEYNSYMKYRSIILTIAFLFIATVTFSLFASINFFSLHNTVIGILDTLASISTLLALVHVYRTKSIQVAAIVGSISLFVFMISFVYVNQNNSFGIIWTIFFPIFVMTLLGRKRGLIILIFYYAILFTMAYAGIGSWQNGAWDLTSFLRYMISSLVLSFVIYMNELSLERAQTALDEERFKEQNQAKELERLSITDPLTSLHNRRYFNTIFEKTLQRPHRKNDFFIFFILDVDSFKLYNDTYGHQAGDQALQSVANV